MINLLPYDYKQDVYFARKNSTALKVLLFLIAAAIGVLALFSISVLYARQQTHHAENQLAEKKQDLKNRNVEATYKNLDTISNNTKLALQVLSREILFSKLINQIGKIMPGNAELTGLKIERDKIDGGITLEAATLDIKTATQLQLNLQDKNNQVFEKVDIEKVSCVESPEKRLPCIATMKASFLKEKNPYMFINSSASSKSETIKQ